MLHFDSNIIEVCFQRSSPQETSMSKRWPQLVIILEDLLTCSILNAREAILREVDNLAVDALTPCITTPSAAMVLNTQNKPVFVFIHRGFQSSFPTQC